jgi:hypothetical protein
MATQDLRSFVEDRLRAFDPTIDLNNGSPAQDQVVDPIVRRFTPDPFEMDLDKYITARLEQEFPDTNFREGSGVRDLLVKPANLLMDPIYREVQLIKQAQSLIAPELLSPEEADALVANIFISRTLGGLATGFVRLFFNAPVAVNISVGNVCFTSSGLRYIPTTLQSVSAETMVFNQSGNLYYFDINVTAESPGEDYNIDRNEIVGITNLNVTVRVANLNKFSSGLNEETTSELVTRAETSITERSLVVPRGVSARLFSQFTALQHLQVIGHSDPEMLRDIITGGDLGPILLSGNDGFTEDDGDGDSLSSIFQSRFSDFTTVLPAGPVENHTLTVNEINQGFDGEFLSSVNHFKSATIQFEASDVGSMLITFNTTDPLNAGHFKILSYVDPTEVVLVKVGGSVETNVDWILIRNQQEFPIVEVFGPNELKVEGSLRVDRQVVAFSIRQKVLELSEIPGGILFTADQGNIEIQSDEIHIGGASDFYVKGATLEKETMVLPAVSDENPVLRGLTGSSDFGSVQLAEFFRDTSANFVVAGVKPGMSLVVESGPDAGSKSILRVGRSNTGADPQYLQVSPSFTATAVGLRYKIVDDLDINLRQPREIRGEGVDGQTIAGNPLFTTTAAVDFLALGVVVGDTLRLKSGFDQRDFVVLSIGGTGNRDLTLNGSPTSTAVAIEWEVFASSDGLSFPLIRLVTLDILDSSNQPTGDTIPYADPVDARSEAFSNAGRGVKLEIIDAITGIVGTADMDVVSYPLTATTLGVKINNDTTINIVLTGALNKTAVLNLINAAIPNIAELLDVSGDDRLTLRSRDRWIQVTANAQNTNVGLSAAGEDNRQIKSLADVSDWTAAVFDLKRRTDVVSIQTGDNIGFYYIVDVQPTKILVAGFDEAAGTVRFLQPNADISITAGSRSFGKARVYFLDPTSFEVRGDYRPALKNSVSKPVNLAVFTAAELAASASIPVDEEEVSYFTADLDGVQLRFFPDPELKYVVIPDLDSDVPNNLATVAADGTVTSNIVVAGTLGKNSRVASVDFLTRELRVGDLLDITFQPIQGSANLAAFVWATLIGKTLILAVDGAPAKTLTFTSDVTSLTKLTSAINDFYGVTIAFIETIAGAKHLRLEADFPILVKKNGTSNTDFGFSTITDTNNRAVANIDGFYTVTVVGEGPAPALLNPTVKNKLDVLPAPATSGESQHFRILRPGVQRIHSTAMNDQTEIGLYYMDVELISEGPGDLWNIPDGTELFVTGHKSDGYRLHVIDPNLSYSTEEDVEVSISQRVLAVGQSDRPDQATLISRQNLQVNYERSALAASIQSFASSNLERVLTASLLVRHLFPTFVNFEMSYRGGSGADIVTTDVNDHLADLGPDERVEASDIQNKPLRRGATFVENPLTLVAVAHDSERKIAVARSVNFVTKGRLSAWFTGNINIVRET